MGFPGMFRCLDKHGFLVIKLTSVRIVGHGCPYYEPGSCPGASTRTIIDGSEDSLTSRRVT
jgi:hypothetical protein